MGREPERAGGHRFVTRECRRANDDVTTRALNLDFSVQSLCFSVSLWLWECTMQQPQRHRERRGHTEKNLKLRYCSRALTIFARLVVDSTRQFSS